MKYKVENIRCWYITDEHGKHFSALEKRTFFWRKGLHNMVVALQACAVTGGLPCKTANVSELANISYMFPCTEIP